jgi:hypothetical protein
MRRRLRWCCSFPCDDRMFHVVRGALHIARSSVPDTVEEKGCKTARFWINFRLT